MTRLSFAPFPLAAPLRPYIRHFGLKRRVPQGRRGTAHSAATADLGACVVASLGAPFWSRRPDGSRRMLRGMTVLGVSDVPDRFEFPAGNSYIVATFRPGGTGPFFGVPASELTNRIVPIGELWGTEGRELEEKVLEARSMAERARLIEEGLLRRLLDDRLPPDALRQAVRTSLETQGRCSVRRLANETRRSQRHLKRLFERWTGVGTKLFCRITRFQAVLDSLERDRDSAWADRACGHGYSDQAHLIRDFREFAGTSPERFLALR